jgi:hypothetical protein
MKVTNWSSAINTATPRNFSYHVTTQKTVILTHSRPSCFLTGGMKVTVCQCKSCQVMCCWHSVCKCHFLLQMSLICGEILNIVCWTIRELKHAVIVDYLSLILFHFHFEGKMLKIQFLWKNCWPNKKSQYRGSECVILFISVRTSDPLI